MVTQEVLRQQHMVNLFYRATSHLSIYDTMMGLVVPFGERRDFANVLNVKPGEMALEVGAGTGLNFPNYNKNASYTALDINGAMLRKAYKRSRNFGLGNIKFVLGDATELSFADSSFDAALLSYTLSAIPDNKMALDEVMRVVKSGGRIGILDFEDTGSHPMLGSFGIDLERMLSSRRDLSITIRIRKGPIMHPHWIYVGTVK